MTQKEMNQVLIAKNQLREIQAQKKIKLIYLKYLKLIDKELSKFRDSDVIFIALLFSRLSAIITAMYKELRIFINNDLKELTYDNFTFPYSLLVGITIAQSVSYDRLSINKHIGKTITDQLRAHELGLKKVVYGKIFEFVETGYQNSKINDIIYYKKGKLLSGDIAKVLKLYRTESTRLRSESKLEAVENLKKLGFKIYRQWLYTWESVKPRHEHILSNGLRENSQGYFSINGYLTKGPGLFGVPSEDINCRCDTEIYVDEQQ